MKRLLKWIRNACLVLFVLGIVGTSGLVWWLHQQVPSIDTLAAYEPDLITKVYDRQGKLLVEFAKERREIVYLEDLPKYVTQAFLAAEDDNFYAHFGIEPLGIIRAAWNNIVAGQTLQGASTITQQVARTFFLSLERTILRKLKEMYLAIQLERNLSKDEILFLYLNQIYFGRGAYGIGSASELYFGKPASKLNVAEASVLAGVLPSPNRYAPHVAPKKARVRQLYVLGRMSANGWLSPIDLQNAKDEVVQIRSWRAPFWQAPYVSDTIRQWLFEHFGENAVMRGGLRVYTTLDLDLIQKAEAALRQGVDQLDKRQGYRGPITNITDDQTLAEELGVLKTNILEEIEYSRGATTIAQVGPEPKKIRPDELRIEDLGTKRFPAVVTGIVQEDNYAWVNYGLGTAILPGETVRWAREPNPEIPFGKDTIEHIQDRLTVGDKIWVSQIVRTGEQHDYLAKFSRVDDLQNSPFVQLEQIPIVQGALSAAAPDTGDILAIVGGYDYKTSQYNRAISAKRQVGSSFKPIVYAAALEKGYTPASILIDKPIIYEDVEREFRWKPKNYGGKFYGAMTLIEALTLSRNIVTIQLVREIGLKNIGSYARRLGLGGSLPRDLSAALGSGASTLMDLVRLYSVFASNGNRPELNLVREVWDATGDLVYHYVPPLPDHELVPYMPYHKAPSGEGRSTPFKLRKLGKVETPLLDSFPQVLTPQTAYQIHHMLRNVVERGTGWRARELGRPVAGKTGTTNDNVDSWFVGYSPDLVAVTWVGYDQSKPLGDLETGSRAALPIWVDFMKQAHQGQPIREFAIPNGILFQKIDASTGELANSLSKKIWRVPMTPETKLRRTNVGETKRPGDDLFQQDDFFHGSGSW